MPEFLTPVDICNRALQRVGAIQIGALTDNNARAQAVNFCYGKLRRAELGRNTWGFATKKATLRPIDTNTMFFTPPTFGTNTYLLGSLVTDSSGTLWECIASHTGASSSIPPSTLPSIWQPYFGPLTVEPFDSSKAYNAGELVYTISGNGTFYVYKSKVNANAVHPAVQAQWDANTIYAANDVVNVYPAWSSLTTYSQGQAVKGTDGNIYVSLINSNLNHSPPSSQWQLMPILDLQSQLMPTSQFTAPSLVQTTPIDEWSTGVTYSTGSFVMQIANIYMSLVNSNTGNSPVETTGTDWVQVTNGTTYQSMFSLNQGNNPTASPAPWSSLTTYSIGQQVGVPFGDIFVSLTNGNINNNPPSSPSQWTDSGTLWPWTTGLNDLSGNPQWLLVASPGGAISAGGTLNVMGVTWPANSGPFSQTWNRNLYRLPAGYLRRAPQMPAAGRGSWLGFPGNLTDTDWEVDDNFIVTWDSNAITFRFVADMQDVTKFPDMFSEGLSCRIAVEICETLTQSSVKIKEVEEEYKQFMTEARLVGAIETRSNEPPLDDFIATRI